MTSVEIRINAESVDEAKAAIVSLASGFTAVAPISGTSQAPKEAPAKDAAAAKASGGKKTAKKSTPAPEPEPEGDAADVFGDVGGDAEDDQPTEDGPATEEQRAEAKDALMRIFTKFGDNAAREILQGEFKHEKISDLTAAEIAPFVKRCNERDAQLTKSSEKKGKGK